MILRWLNCENGGLLVVRARDVDGSFPVSACRTELSAIGPCAAS